MQNLLWIVLITSIAGVTSSAANLGAPKKEARPTIANSVGMKLTLIRKGEFQMGSAELPSELPVHQVRITKEFYLAIHHVTVAQFRAFVKDTNHKTDAEKNGKGALGFDAEASWLAGKLDFNWKKPGFEQADDHPVVCVSWHDAVAFCQWLSKKEQKTYRLPTEAEWEHACRAGTTTRFSCGDKDEDLKGYANLGDEALKAKVGPKIVAWNAAPKGNTSGGVANFDDGYVFTSPVGKFRPNPWGLYDMHGNAWQWCHDGNAKYQAGPQDDPVVAPDGANRCIRGGAWFIGPLRCRSANRVQRDAKDSFCFVGFRVARTPD